MICVVEGPPGSGKSYSCIARVYEALNRGEFVATNIEMADGWAHAMARMNWGRRLIPGRVKKYEQRYQANTFVSGDIDELMRVRMPGTKEGRGLLLLDEAHNWCNARTWQNDDRQKLLRFFSQHRKLGWDVFLVTQRAENIDMQIRSLAEYRITLRNMRRIKLLGLPVLPFNLFLALWSWEGGVGDLCRRDFYRLNRKLARLYNTLATSHGLEDEEFEPIMLPQVFEPPESSVEDQPASDEEERAA